jgi:hypothetical protein
VQLGTYVCLADPFFPIDSFHQLIRLRGPNRYVERSHVRSCQEQDHQASQWNVLYFTFTCSSAVPTARNNAALHTAEIAVASHRVVEIE